VFFNWVPLNVAPPVPQVQPLLQTQFLPQIQLQPHLDAQQTYAGPSHQRIDSVAAAGPANIRQGKKVFGSYDGRNAQPGSHYEQLDPCILLSTFLLQREANISKRSTSEIRSFSLKGGYVSSL